MTFRPEYIPKQQPTAGIVPFASAEEAWFWLVAAQEARTDGARVVAGQGKLPRPCEPVDILRVVDRLYRQRRLMRDHLLVLRYYGKRRLPPEPRRLREARAFTIWTEALERIEAVLIAKGIVGKIQTPVNQEWLEAAE
jgi:hypothetical protein